MYVFRTMNSFSISFCMVPFSSDRSTPLSSAATTNIASVGRTAPFIVMLTDILPRSIPSNNVLKVLYTIYRYAGQAHIALCSRMVGVVASMRR